MIKFVKSIFNNFIFPILILTLMAWAKRFFVSLDYCCELPFGRTCGDRSNNSSFKILFCVCVCLAVLSFKTAMINLLEIKRDVVISIKKDVANLINTCVYFVRINKFEIIKLRI